ncbi:MAG TPA: hypothetical protein VGF52_04375, partial [Tepidisphaeraceae bacterium]
ALTVKDARIVVYVNGKERGVIEVTPEAKVIWRLFPKGGFALSIGKYGFRVYAAIYRLLVFIPFSALLGAMIVSCKWSPPTKRIVAVVVIVAMALALEIILGTQAASGFQIRNLAISLVVAFGMLGAMRLITARMRA